jgi:DNA-binding Xre family transcriptional regulator
MIIYKKLEGILKEKNMQWKDLCNAGISVNMPTKFSKNKPMNTDIINKVCEYLQVQPSEIMEWIPDAEYNKANAEIASIEAQIAELEAKKKQLQGK